MRNVLRRLLRGGVTFVVLMGIAIGANYAIGGDIGAPCSHHVTCRGFLIQGAKCVHAERARYCTRTCSGDGDCPPGWSCNTARKSGGGSSLDVCVRR
jgi:hypothetical protein